MESEIYEHIFQPEIYETYLKEHKKRKKKLLVRLVCFRQGLAVTYSGHEHSIFLSYLCPVPTCVRVTTVKGYYYSVFKGVVYLETFLALYVDSWFLGLCHFYTVKL